MTIQYQGGYYLFQDPLVRGWGPNGHTANDLSSLSNYTVEAVNHIQDTPWQVNRFTLDLIQSTRKNLLNSKGEVVLRLEEPQDFFNPMSKEEWLSLPNEEKLKHRTQRRIALDDLEETTGEYTATVRIISLAAEMKEHAKLYFPHNLDFRLRIYPIPTDLNPQSNDLSKGLLRFARPNRLGEEGLFWMGFTVASHFGEDKLLPEDRFLFASDPKFISQCRKWVSDPLRNRGWLDADSPFQFLAVAHEWVLAHSLKNPTEFLSHLPGNLDGSCNGAQHLSLLARDMVGATATNCRSRMERQDLYMAVADRVLEKVLVDAKEGDEIAAHWASKLASPKDRRTVVKRAVMTVPYGVTSYGVASFMLSDNHVDRDAANRWAQAKYLRDHIMASIDETLSVGRSLQLWFRDCAVECAKNGKPLIWDTPAGSKVTMAYRSVVAKRISSFSTRFYVYEEMKPNETKDEYHNRLSFDEKRMSTAASPNVVHSCDAAHLQITVCRMHDAGIKDFSMIHDSFGCPFSQVGLMRDILRQSVVDMYAGDYLTAWKESVEKYSGLTMPDPPALGTFDINEVLESEYFFS